MRSRWSNLRENLYIDTQLHTHIHDVHIDMIEFRQDSEQCRLVKGRNFVWGISTFVAEMDGHRKSFWANAISLQALKRRLWKAEKNGLAEVTGWQHHPGTRSAVRSGRFVWNISDFTSCLVCYFKVGFIIKHILKRFKMLVECIGFMPDVLISASWFSLSLDRDFWAPASYGALTRCWVGSGVYVPNGKTGDWWCSSFVGNFYLKSCFLWRFKELMLL